MRTVTDIREAAGRWADQGRKPCLDVHVNVFKLAGKFEITAFDL